MKRIRFDLIRAHEDLAGARQCIVCLCAALLTASGTALGCFFGVMQGWMLAVAVGLLLGFMLLGAVFACLPEWRERRLERMAWREGRSGWMEDGG